MFNRNGNSIQYDTPHLPANSARALVVPLSPSASHGIAELMKEEGSQEGGFTSFDVFPNGGASLVGSMAHIHLLRSMYVRCVFEKFKCECAFAGLCKAALGHQDLHETLFYSSTHIRG